MKSEDNIMWKDRKRVLGLPLSFTKYCIKNNRLYTENGFLSTKEDELLLYRILDFRLERSFFDKIFGVGTITLYTCDETDKELKLAKIKRPKEVRDMLSDVVEEAREKYKLKGREIYGVSHLHDVDNDID